ncbi:lipoprotein [Betaproteobacteria bacterium]|nr:lipoprotein [Betaproteobacteria bacterium]GHU02738.1 lipoprotein [Betaproteobacteria bacterium]GHU09285.1 lipoprotein [Betaproteobacteria bacterium]GHU21654.1 lipoprotein [Betaproteobacteria bacterium]
MTKRFHSLLWLCMLSVAVLVSACGDDAQRKAFIEFLQNKTTSQLNRVAVPSDQVRESFGDYAQQYDLIIDFHRTLNDQVKAPLKSLGTDFAAAMNFSTGIAERRAKLVQLNTAFGEMNTMVERALKEAEDKLTAFKQPDDVKAAYTPVFDLHVRKPARTFSELVPLFSELITKATEMLDFVEANPDKISTKGGRLEVKDQSTLNRLTAFQKELAAINKKVQAVISQYRQGN